MALELILGPAAGGKTTKLEEKMERWVYLNDLAEQIAAQ